MAIIRKFSPKENLNFFNTFIDDANPNSTYFRISEFKEDFTGGKNGFTIEGSEHLKETTELKIEILDVNGNTIYFEPGDGIPEYYEGISKVVSVHVYDDTPIGIAEITILGELKTYERTDGSVVDVPDEWKGVYNVKWKRRFKVNRLLPNEDKVRFYRRPKIQIDELAKPIFSTTSNTVTQLGTIVGTPNIPLAGTSIRNYTQPTSYRIDLSSGPYWSGSIVGSQLQIPSLNYSPTVIDIIDRDTVIVREPYTVNNIVQPFGEVGYTASFNENPSFIQNNLLTGSFSKIRITDLKTFVGDVVRVKVFRKSQSTAENFQLVQEIQLESNELLVDLDVTDKTEEFYGLFTEPILAEYWTTSSNDLQTSFTQEYLYNSVVLDGTSTPHLFYSDRVLDIDEGVEYTLSFGARLSGTAAASNYVQPFISGSRTVVVDGTPITTQVRQNITRVAGLTRYLEKNQINANFIAEDIDNPKLYFEVIGSGWHLNEVSLTASQESSFSPDQITFVQVVPRNLPVETFDFRFEFYDINNNYIPVRVTAQKTFSAGNLQQLNRTFRITPTSLFFTFNPSGQSIGNNVITFNIEKTQLTGSVTFTSGAYDSGGLLIPSESYTGQYPGLLTNITETSATLTSANFTGSDAIYDVSYIQYVAQCEDLQSTVIIGEVIDGESSKGVLVQADHNQFFYKRSTTGSTHLQSISIRANKINIPPSSSFTIISSSNSPTVPPITLSAGGLTSTEIYAVDTNVFQYDDGPTEYEFYIEDEFGNPFTSSIVIESVVDGAAANLKLSRDNHTYVAKSTGELLSSITDGNVDIDLFVGSDQIDYVTENPIVTTNRWSIIGSNSEGVTATSITVVDGNTARIGISSFDSIGTESGSVYITASYLDGTGVSESIRRKITYNKTKKAASVLQLVILNGNQTQVAKSTGEQITPFVTASFKILETYDGVTLTKNYNSHPTVTSSTGSYNSGFNPTESTITLPNLPNNVDSVELEIEGPVTDIEGSVRPVSGSISLAKNRNSAPSVTVTADPQTQTIAADSSGVQQGLLKDVTITVKEGNTTLTPTNITITSDLGFINPPITIVGNVIQLSDEIIQNSTSNASLIVTASYTDSEGTAGSKGLTITANKLNEGAVGTAINVLVNPTTQIVTRTIDGEFSQPTPFTVQVFDGTTQYDFTAGTLSGGDFKITNVFSASGITNGETSSLSTITPLTPTTLLGTNVSFDVEISSSANVLLDPISRSHRVGVSPEGQTGPGIVFTGVWEPNRVYQFSAGVNDPGTARRDVVLWSSGGNRPYDTYYATLKQHTSNENDDTVDGDGPPNVSTGSVDSAWQSLGTQDFFVAAKIGIFEESYVQNTLNVGTTTTGSYSAANITIAGGLNDPYISIGQFNGQDYGLRGIFIGSGSAAKLSLVNPTDTRALKWDGSDLSITGSLNITGNSAIGGILTVSQSNPGYANEGIFIGVSENKARLSLRSPAVSGRYNSLEWNGENLIIRGGIRQTSAGIVVTESIQRGTWTPNTEYDVGNIVQYAENGNPTSSYSATSTHTSSDDVEETTGKPGFGPWEIFAQSGQTSKVVQLSATSYVIAYDADNSNPTPSSITLIASSSNFANGWFLFEGEGLSDTFEVGDNVNNDSITLDVATEFPNYFSTPKTYTVKVGEGNDTEITSDRITIYGVKPGLPGTPGDSSIEYKIIPKNGTQIKNSDGTLELQAVRISGSILTELSSGDYKLASGSTVGSILTVGTGITAGLYDVEYNPIIGRDFISGSVTIYLITGSSGNEVTWDTITLVDVEDGLGGGSFKTSGLSGLSMRRSDNTNTFTPSSIQATASFFSVRGTEYTSSFELFPSYSVAENIDFMKYVSGITSDNIGISFSNGDDEDMDGNVYKPTKDVVVTATFTDPFVGKKTTIQETYFIISDGIDGADAYTIVVPNNSHVFTADSSGVVSDYTNSGTTISVLKGIDILQATTNTIPTVGQFSASIASSTNITPTSSFTVSGNDIVYGNHSNMTSADNAAITYTIFLEGTTLTVNTQQTFSKSKAGISGSAAKVVSLSATSFVVAYNQDNTTPIPSSITLIASSSNFSSPQFKFAGGGDDFTDEITYTVGTNNNDTASFDVPDDYFDTPLQFRVGVADGDQTEVASDTITITAIKPGSDSDPQYFLTPLDGTQIKNSNPNQTLRIQAQKSDPLTGLTNLDSGDIKIYSGSLSGSQLASLTGFSNTTDYFVQVSASAIDGIKVFTLKSGSTTYDSITLLDVTDGLGGGTFLANSLSTIRLADNTFDTNPLRVTASFFDSNVNEYVRSFDITASFDGTSDKMAVLNLSADPNNIITISANDGDGNTITIGGNSVPTKDVNVIATFTDPNSGQVTKVQETFYIVSDGKDGEDAITITNSNQAHVVPSTNSGIVTVVDLVGSGTTIEVFEGINKLTRVTSNVINGQYTVTASVSPGGSMTTGSITGTTTVTVGDHTAMSQNVSSSVITYTINGKRADGNLFSSLTTQTLTKAKTGQSGSDGETGLTGPGLVYRGEWSGSTAYSSSENRKDIVFYDINGNENKYWIASSSHTSAGGNKPPAADFWETFGATFTSIATSFILTEDAVATRTISVGENGSISIVGGSGDPQSGTTTVNPYISIGQGNNQGYDKSGIFLGITGGSSTKGSGIGSFSISGSQGALKWNGSILSITGSLDVVGNSKVSGTITVGTTTNVKIGPSASADTPIFTPISSTLTIVLPEFSGSLFQDPAAAPKSVSHRSDTITSTFKDNQLKWSGNVNISQLKDRLISGYGMPPNISASFASGLLTLYIESGSERLSSTNISFNYDDRNDEKKFEVITANSRTTSTTIPYILTHTHLVNGSVEYSLKSELSDYSISNIKGGSQLPENEDPTFDLDSIGTLSNTLTRAIPNMAIRNTGIYVNYDGNEVSLLDVALSGGSSGAISIGGGGGGVISIISGDGLSGGTITTTGTISLDTGSLHFISGSRKTLSVVDTAGSSGINLEYDSGSGVLSGSLVTSSFTIGTTTLSLGETTSSISGLTSLTSINITGSNISASGTITGNTFSVNNISTNELTASGNVKLGDDISDSHTITGSLGLSGSMNVNGSSTFTTITTTGNVKLGDDISDSHTITGSLGVNGSVKIKSSDLISLDIQGNSGQLFSVNDSLIGELMSVNDISGLPILEVSSDDKVVMGTFGAYGLTITGSNVKIGNTSSNSHTINGSLGISGSVNVSGSMTVTGSLTLNQGDFQSPDYTELGYGGTGFKLISGSDSDPIGGSGLTGGYKLELDHLLVRGTMKIYELLINQIRATNGTLFVSSVGKVDGVTNLGTINGSASFALTFDTGSGGLLGHGFLVNDLIRAQRYTPNNGSSATVFQSDLVVKGISSNGKIVTASAALQGTKAPEVGYEYVRLGNTSTSSRQGTVYLTADDQNAPYISVIDGVSSHTEWNTLSKLKARMGKLDGIDNTTFGDLSGYGFYASGSAYLEGGINATEGSIANWSIVDNAITSSNIHLSSSNGGVIRMGLTLPTSHTSGNGIFLSGSGQALIGNATGSRIQFDGSNLILSSSTFLLGNASNFISGSGGNIRISGSNVQVLTPSFLFGGSGQFISGSGGNLEISSSNFHLLNGNMTASNGSFSGRITATTGSFTGNVSVGSSGQVIIGPDVNVSTNGTSANILANQSDNINNLIYSASLLTNVSTYRTIGSTSTSTQYNQGKFILVTGSFSNIATPTIPSITIKTLDGYVEVELRNVGTSTTLSSTSIPFRYEQFANPEWTIPNSGNYELSYTIPTTSNISFLVRYRVFITGVGTNSPATEYGGINIGTINRGVRSFDILMAIRSNGIFVNYGQGQQSLLDIALTGGGGSIVAGGGSGTVTSITAGNGLLADNVAGGSITSIGTLSLSTGSNHFITGSRNAHITGFTNQPSPALSSAAVISQITVTTQGHVSGVSTRNLTAADIGAQPTIVNAVTGTGVSGRVSFWNETSTITSSANLTFDGTKLTTLHISASGGITGSLLGSATTAVTAGSANSATTALTASLALDVQSLSATKITSDRLSLDRLPTSATVNTILKVTTANQSPTYTTLSAIDIPNISTEKITSGVLPIVRGGTGANSFTSGRILYAGSTSVTSSANLTFDGTKLTTLQISASGGITGSLLGSSTFAALAAFASSATTSISSSFVNISTITTNNNNYSIPFVLNSGYSQMGVDGTGTSGHLQYNPSTNTLFVGQNSKTAFGKIVFRTKNDADNQNGSVTLQPPLYGGTNYNITLPSAAGTLARKDTSDVGVTSLTMGVGMSGSSDPITSTGTIRVSKFLGEIHELGNGDNAGFLVQTGEKAISRRSIQSGSNNITISNTNGQSGNPIIDVRNIAGLSVMGRSGEDAGGFVDISAGEDHRVLRRSGSTLGFGSLNLGQSNAITGTLPVGNGGTGGTSFVSGRILYGNGSSVLNSSAKLTFDGSTLRTTGNLLVTSSTTNIGVATFQDSNRRGAFFGINGSGNFYIAPITGSDGNIYFNGQFMFVRSSDNWQFSKNILAPNFILSSDRRLKKDISDIETSIELVSQLQPKEYIKNGNKEFGFITDEIPEELDFLVKRGGEYEALDYISIIALLTKSIQELKRELDDIKSKIKSE